MGTFSTNVIFDEMSQRHSEMLDCIFQDLTKQASQAEKETLVFISSTLQRVECQEMLLKHGFPKQYQLSDLDQQTELFHILLTYTYYWEEIISIIRRYKTIHLPEIGGMYTRDCLVHFSYRCFTQKWCCKEIKGC